MPNWAIVKDDTDPQVVKTIVESQGKPHVEEPGYTAINENALKPGWVYEEEPIPPPSPGQAELDALQDEVTALTVRVDGLDARVSALEGSGGALLGGRQEKAEPK